MATKISQKGIRTAESAVSADVAGRYAEAVRLYGDAVEMLLCGSKYEKNPFTVDHLRFYAEDCALLRARSARALSCAWSRRLSCFCALALSFHCDRNRAPFSGALAALLCRADRSFAAALSPLVFVPHTATPSTLHHPTTRARADLSRAETIKVHLALPTLVDMPSLAVEKMDGTQMREAVSRSLQKSMPSMASASGRISPEVQKSLLRTGPVTRPPSTSEGVLARLARLRKTVLRLQPPRSAGAAAAAAPPALADDASGGSSATGALSSRSDSVLGDAASLDDAGASGRCSSDAASRNCDALRFNMKGRPSGVAESSDSAMRYGGDCCGGNPSMAAVENGGCAVC